MRAFKTKWFVRFARRERISDAVLRQAVREVQDGRIDAVLGGGVIKQRLARRGGGKSGGFRVLLAYRRNALAVFLYGFAKSERGNIDDDELETLRDIARKWFEANDGQLARAVQAGELEEVEIGDGY